jgi:aminoglycoside phosphotransferase (APT) family kinase protein
LIHRDYHPGNVLVDAGAVSGIVDWPNACAGPPEVDVAHCRVNLAVTHGLEVATAFAAFAATDPQRQAYWDVVDCLDLLDDEFEATRKGRPFDPAAPLESLRATGAPKLAVELVRDRLDEYIADAVRRLVSS